MERGLIFNIQKYSVHDGPGIRTTVFLKGCPLCCAWCHNPEGIAARPELLVLESRCASCGACREACPFGGTLPATGAPGPLPTQMPDCTRCGACVEACPGGARQMAGREMTVREVLAEVLADRIFYEDSGGGVTFSGGEPLAQPRFLRALLTAAREHGVHTTVDTSGFGCTDELLAVAALTDLFLFDLKLLDDARHREFTGVSNRPILANLAALDAVHRNLWLRVPLIPGINDDAANLTAVAGLAATLRSARQISVLPYHRTAATKFRRLGRDFVLDATLPPSPAAVAAAAAVLRTAGLPVHTGS
jgi:pyruvate formate lyase activating enzyme